MASVIGEAFVAIRPDTKGFGSEMRSGLASQSKHEESVRVRPDTGRFGADVQQGVSSQSGALSKAGDDAGQTAGKGVGDGMNRGASDGLKKLAVGIGALFVVAAVKGTIDAGSDLNETLSKTQVVFKDAAPAALAFGDNAATGLGESKQAALEQLSTLGNLIQSLGFGSGAALMMSGSMVQLAADLGSLNNVGTDEALEAIRAGLTGEAEPLKRFGVNINEAVIQAKALELGLVKGTGATEDIATAQIAAEKAQAAYTKAVTDHGAESIQARDAAAKQEQAESKLNDAVAGKVPALTAAQKAQATYSLILDQTSLAQGNFALTANDTANKQKTLQAQTADLRAEIGLQLLPVYKKLLEIGGQIIAYIKDHQGQAKILAFIVGTVLVVAFGAWAASAIAAAFVTALAMAPVLIALFGIGLLIADAILLWQRFGPAVTDAVNSYVVPALNTAIDLINGVIDLLNLIPGVNIGKVPHLSDGQDTGVPGAPSGVGPGYGGGPGGYAPGSAPSGVGPGYGGGPGGYAPGQDPNRFAGLDFLNHMSGGGWVPGTGNRDSVPTMLTPGEYVMSRDEVARGRGETHNYYFTGQPNNPTQFVLQVAKRRRLVSSLAAL